MFRKIALALSMIAFALLAAFSYAREAKAIQGEFLRLWLKTNQCLGQRYVEEPFNGLIDMAIRSQTLAVFEVNVFVDGGLFLGSSNLCIGRPDGERECGDSRITLGDSLDSGYSQFEYVVETSPKVSGNISLTLWMFLEGGCSGGLDDPNCRWYSASTTPVVTQDYCQGPWTPTETTTSTPTRRPSKTPTATETVTETPTVASAPTLTQTTTPTVTPRYHGWYFPLVFK